MTILPVDTVFFARYNISNFRALYGRFGGEPKTYTKDYFQLADQTEDVLKKAFAFSGKPVSIEYMWPGGTQTGQLLFSSDRLHLSWPTGGPEPWRVGAVGGAISIPGDAQKTAATAADDEYNRIVALGHNPWLLGMILVGEPTKMHIRVYFENPPTGLEDRKVEDLPTQIVGAIKALAGNAGTGAFAATRPAPAPRAAALVQQIEEALARNPNVLLIGPPGTGKTVALEDLRAKYSVTGNSAPLYFDTDSWGASAFSKGDVPGEQRSEALVFHPSYAYENFVAGLFPKSSDKGVMELGAMPGPLLRLSHWVGTSERKALLVLDEFNRGPAAAIFGDTLGLLDKDKRSSASNEGAHIQRPYPDYPMGVSKEYAVKEDATNETIAAQFSLPAGLAIVAAMNSTDRSVAPLDAAMRRRFHIIRVNPDYDVLTKHFGLNAHDVENEQLPASNDPAAWNRHHILVLAIRVLKATNHRIRFCLGEDFLLGHALLWNLDGSNDQTALSDLSGAMDGFILSTLRTTFLDQDDFLAAVLGIPDSATKDAAVDSTFVGYWQTPPKGLEKVAPRRLILPALSEKPPQSQLASLIALAKS